MGVYGLATYVDKEESFWTEIELHDTGVVIDGNALLYHLYFQDNDSLDYRSGGQYRQFHDKIVAFFKCLEENNVEPYVLLDGASDPSDNKLETSIRRTNKKIERARLNSDTRAQTLPLLARQTFIQALKNCSGVRFAVCDFEADPEIAALAAKLECPVISSDSDFFIFDLKAGYIPLKHLKWGSEQLKAKLFKMETFCAQLGIQNELLPLFASLLANDIVTYDDLKYLYSAMVIGNRRDVNEKIRVIQGHFERQNVESIQEGIECILQICTRRNSTQSKLRRVLESSVNSYKVGDSKVEHYFTGEYSSSLRSRKGVPFKPWVLKHFHKELFPSICMDALTVGRVFLHPQVENFGVQSAHQCSLALRRFLYGLQGEMEVNEFERNKVKGREKATVQKYKVSSADYKQSTGEPLRLDRIPCLNLSERCEVVLSILESNTDPIRALPTEDQLFVASVRYWIKHAEPAVHQSHLLALLVCYLMLAKDEHSQQAANNLLEDEFDLTAQHNLAQWQCVMHEALNVNFILLEPLPTPSIWNLYDGLLVQRLVQDLEEVSPESTSQARRLYKAAKDGIRGRLLPKRREYNVPTSNRFEALQDLNQE